MTTAAEEVERLRKEAEAKMAEADRVSRLHAEFPDLKKHVDRWKTERYYSKTVNARVQRFEIRHACGCCSDSPLDIWPYFETPHGNVYSDPPRFQVGEKHWISGDTPYPDWEEKLRTAEIPESIVGAVQVHFDQCKRERIALAEES